MQISHFLAIRYLKSSAENRFFSWITVLATAGIAIGVAALIVVLSVINGFEYELRKRFLHANAHIMAYRYPAGMKEPEKWGDIIKKDFKGKVKGVSPFIHYETMIKNGSIMHGVLIRGISPKKRERVQSLRDVVSPPESLDQLQEEIIQAMNQSPPPEEPGLILGAGLVKIINTKVGDTVKLVAPSQGKTELRDFKVVGIYNSGLKHYDNRLVAMSIPSAQKFFNLGDIVTGLEIGLYDNIDSKEIEAAMKNKYRLTFREWQSFNRHLFEAMEKERLMIAVIVALVVMVAALNILTTIFVSVSQKQKDISILKSLGATNRQIIRLFVNQGAYIGMIGGILGGVLALIISWFLENHLPRLLELPDPYFLKTLPVHYSLGVYLAVMGSALLLCLIAGLYPAIIASKVEPSSGFRGNAGLI